MKKSPKSPGFNLLYDLVQDMRLILAYNGRSLTFSSILSMVFASDAYAVIAMFRIRKWCVRHRIPFINRILRFLQTLLYSIELGIDIELGHGVYFVHTLGTVVGGHAKIGNCCVFMGNNTIGAAREFESPIIEDFTVIGAGARIIGELTVGDTSFIGANAVVTKSIPAQSVAAGIPAQVIKTNQPTSSVKRMKEALQLGVSH